MCLCQTLLRTGDEDLCYYNFDCSHPIRYLSSFNNVISNMGYVMLGLLFSILVWRRSESARIADEGGRGKKVSFNMYLLTKWREGGKPNLM